MTDLSKIIANWNENGTTGPWRAGNRHAMGLVASADGETLVANTHGSFRGEDRERQIREQDANRDLIAAAPDMVKRIEALEEDLRTVVELADAGMLDEACDRARAAIQEAEDD